MSVKDLSPRIPPGSTAVLSLFLVSILAVAAFAAPALAASVTVVADGQTRTLTTSAATVADVLAEAGLTLAPGLDRAEPSPRTPATDGLVVTVTRVATVSQVEEVARPLETFVYDDPGLALGTTKVVSEGQAGFRREHVRIWYKEGVPTLREVLRTETIVPAEERVVLRGGRGLADRSGSARRLILEATAYDPGPRSCGKYASGYTATGLRAGRGVVAVDPRVIPLGTRLYVDGYGLATAGDVGGAIKGYRIDLGYNTYREALRFGRHKVVVYILG